jgi:hypothetical protein
MSDYQFTTYDIGRLYILAFEKEELELGDVIVIESTRESKIGHLSNFTSGERC